MAQEPNEAVRWIEDQMRNAAQLGVSDIVLEPQDDGGYLVVVRRDGFRETQDQCNADVAIKAIGRLKALAHIPAYIKDEPQDGSFDGRDLGIDGHVRLAVLPTIRGQRLALRLPALKTVQELNDLGFESDLCAQLKHCIRQPDGLLLISGPSGSGKTTTLHALLNELVTAFPERAVVAIEDPVERRLSGVTHVAVQESQGFDFLAALRAALRQDVDVLVVGEIRDGQTATACVRAALAGHLVLASIHAPRARDVVPRLFEMGVDPDLLLPSLHGVMAQRLLRRGSHLSGRCAVADWIDVTAHARLSWRRRESSAVTLVHDMDRRAAELIRDGITERPEVIRVLGTNSA